MNQFYGSNGCAIDSTTGAVTFAKSPGLVFCYFTDDTDTLSRVELTGRYSFCGFESLSLPLAPVAPSLFF